MIVSEIKTKLEEIGINPEEVSYQTPKKVYARNGVSHVGMFSRELKQDFWFYDSFTDKLYCLKACWKNRKEYGTDNFNGNTKYQVPLVDFITYDLVKAQKNYTEYSFMVPKQTPDNTGKYISLPSLDPAATTQVRTTLKTRDKKTSVTRQQVRKAMKDNSGKSVVKQIKMIGSKLKVEFTSLLGDRSFTAEISDITGDQLDAILDIIKN